MGINNGKPITQKISFEIGSKEPHTGNPESDTLIGTFRIFLIVVNFSSGNVASFLFFFIPKQSLRKIYTAL